MELSAKRYYTLDGLRGLAALLVMLFHFGADTRQHVAAGYLAVDFFFVLSGFVISKAYTRKLRGGLSFGDFAKMRVVRLYPMYLAGTAIGLLSLLVLRVTGQTSYGIKNIAMVVPFALFMLPSPRGRQLFPLNVPAWSLFIEMVANAAFALLMVRLKSRWLVGIVAISALALIVGTQSAPHMDVGARFATLALGLARAFYSFTLGVLIHRHMKFGRVTSWLMVIPFAAFTAVLLCPAGIFGITFRDLASALIICPLLVLAGMRWEAPAKVIGICAVLGDLSYPLYIVHRPITPAVFWAAMAMLLPNWIAAIAFLAITSAVAWALLKLYDENARARLSAWLGLRESAAPHTVCAD